MYTKTIRILLVEDNPGDVRFVEEMVAESNANTSLDWTFQFEHAERLDQAMDKVLKNGVDVLLLDLMLPDSNGLATLTKILSVSSIPIIVLSGHDDEILALQAVQAGAQDYLVKGRIDSHGLERAVRYSIERKRGDVKLRESEEKYRQLFEMESDAIFLIENETGQILEANQAAVVLYGFERNELLKIKHTDVSAEPEKTRKVTLEGATYVPIRYHRKKDGTVFPVEITARHCVWIGRAVHIAAIRDITQRIEAEKALRENEVKYRLVAENIPVVVYSALPDADSTIVFVSGKVNELTGYTAEEFLSDPKLWNRLMDTDDRQSFWTTLKRHREAKTLLDVEYRIRTKDGRTLWIHNMAVQMLDEVGNITQINGFMEDITRRKETEEALKQSEERFRQLIENNLDLLAQMTPDGRYLYVSPSYKTILGYEPEDLLGKNVDRFVHPKDLKRLMEAIQQTVGQQQKLSRLEYRILHQNGQYCWLEALIKLLYQPGGELSKVQLHSRDITGRKQMEERLQISMHEKDVLLKEIHHRVKNNMQIIVSLLKLQSNQIKEKSLHSLFKESQNRIFSMALVHEMLYKSEDLSKIDLKEYLKKLIQTLFDSYGANQRGIGLDLDLESIVLDIDKVIPCGLIVQEIISNSLKYAFPSEWKEKANVRIGLHRREGNAHLTIGDNGIGIPDKINTKLPKSLGLNLVLILAEQLQAKIKLHKNEGTEFRIVFRVSK